MVFSGTYVEAMAGPVGGAIAWPDICRGVDCNGGIRASSGPDWHRGQDASPHQRYLALHEGSEVFREIRSVTVVAIGKNLIWGAHYSDHYSAIPAYDDVQFSSIFQAIVLVASS